jgi:hypothetical protein
MPDYNTFDLIDLTVDEKPAEVSVAFDELIGQRIVDIIAQKKVEVAQQMFGPQDSEEDDDIEYEDDEFEDEDDEDEDYDDSDLEDLDSEEEEDENS